MRHKLGIGKFTDMQIKQIEKIVGDKMAKLTIEMNMAEQTNAMKKKPTNKE